ncbi:MAG: hypothetical protein WC197_04705 [Candidatus Gastranaerophilaceae bacterium]|jgi:F0F1-type ATP synthase membrane subunit b/b'
MNIDYILNSNILNSIIVLMFLIWIFKKLNILSAIDKKQKEIDDTITLVEIEKKKSEKELNKVEKEYKNVNNEVIKIKETSKQVANSLVAEIHKETQKEIDDITHKTAKNLEEETCKAYGDVSSYISKAALNLAEDHIKKSIDINLHKKFIYEFIEDLDKFKV